MNHVYIYIFNALIIIFTSIDIMIDHVDDSHK